MKTTDNILSFNPMSPSNKALELAKRVKSRRLEMNLTQEGLAVRAGIPLATYRLFERTGKTSLNGLLHIAFALNALDDFDAVFDSPRYASIDEAISATQNIRKRGKRNE